MAMGKRRRRARQPSMWVADADLPRSAGALPLRHVPAPRQPQVARLHQPVVALLLQGAVLRPSNLVDRRPQVLRHVELVERNQRLRVLAHRPDVGRPHVHRHHLDAPAAGFAHRVEIAVEGRGGAAVRHVQHPRLRRRQVVDHRHVLVPPLERRLVDPHRLRRGGRAPRQSSPNRPFLDPRHLVPAQPALPRHRREARHLQPVDHHRLEQRREPRLRFRPRDLDLLHSVLGTADPRYLRPDQRSVLHRVQMAPHPRTSVVARTGGAAGRADQRLARELHGHFDVALVEGQSHVAHAPRPLDAQQLLVESRLGHPASLPTGRTDPAGHDPHRAGASGESSAGPERSAGGAKHLDSPGAEATSPPHLPHDFPKTPCA